LCVVSVVCVGKCVWCDGVRVVCECACVVCASKNRKREIE
jgi:hypothetical protein